MDKREAAEQLRGVIAGWLRRPGRFSCDSEGQGQAAMDLTTVRAVAAALRQYETAREPKANRVVWETNGKLFENETDAIAEQMDTLCRLPEYEQLADENLYELAVELYGYRNPGLPSLRVVKREVN